MARHIPLNEGKQFQMGKGDSRRLVGPDVGASQITMNYSIFQPGQEFPQHIHDASADIFIVLEGGVSVRQGDDYTPIHAGQFAYVPAGEVHGTVNTTGTQATLISFQAPPDPSLYQGSRDPSHTGVVPRPPEGHVTTVQIRDLQSGEAISIEKGRHWTPASPRTGANEMRLSYLEMEPDARVLLPASSENGGEGDAETAWFVWSGTAKFMGSNGHDIIAPAHNVVFVGPGEALQVANAGSDPLRLIGCQAPPK
jgi:mannose-6-phosphate isomerase-like protein (cupin superfamily)